MFVRDIILTQSECPFCSLFVNTPNFNTPVQLDYSLETVEYLFSSTSGVLTTTPYPLPTHLVAT